MDIAQLGFEVDSSGLVRAEKQLDRVDRAGNRATKSGGALKNAIAGIGSRAALVGTGALTLALGAITTGALSAGKEFQRLNRLLSESDLGFVRAESDRLGLSMQVSANGFAKLSAAVAGTSLEGRQAREIFTGLNTAVAGLGLSSEQANGALTAFEQIASKGTVQAEELRGQLGERIPGAFQLAARAMNLTTQELNKQLQLGNVLADDFLPKFAKELENTYSGKALTGAKELTAEQNRFNNVVLEFQNDIASSGVIEAFTGRVKELTQALSGDGAAQAAQALGSSIAFLIKNLGVLANTLIGIGVLLFARKLGSLSEKVTDFNTGIIKSRAETSAYAEALARSSAATVTETANKVKSAQASVTRAKAVNTEWLGEIRLEKTRLQAQISNIGVAQSEARLAQLRGFGTASLKALRIAETELATATAASAAAQNALAPAITRTSVAARIGAAAVTGLNGALALIGGPVGLAVIGGIGLFQMATASTAAEKSLERLKNQSRGLSAGLDLASASTTAMKIQMIEVAQIGERNFLANALKEVSSLDREIQDATRQIEIFQSFLEIPNQSQDNIAGYNAQIKTLGLVVGQATDNQKRFQLDVDTSNVRLGDLAQTLNDVVFGHNENNKATKDASDEIASYGKNVDSILKKEEDRKTAIEQITKALDGELKGNKALISELNKLLGVKETQVKTNDQLIRQKNTLGDSFKNLIDLARDGVNAYGGFETASEAVGRIVTQNAIEDVKANAIRQRVIDLIEEGTLSQEEGNRVLRQAGVETEELGRTSETVQELMTQGWRKFQDGVQDAFFNAFRSGKNFFDSLKDLGFDILAQISAKIATTFVFDKLGLGSSGSSGIGRLLNNVLGGSSTPSSGTPSIGGSDLIRAGISAAGITPTSLGGVISSALGLTGAAAASSALVATGATTAALASGSATAALATVPTSILPASFATAGGGAATGGIFSASGSIGGLFTTGGFFGPGGAIAKGFGTLVTTLGPVGLAIAGVAAAAAIFGGGRSRQELGEDQLRAVDEATRAGRNEQVQLGQAGSTSLSFLGGFDENSTFFGVDLLQEQLQQVGDVLQERFGFNQALALKDGVIRLEDFSREFSKNNEQIVDEVKASIIQVELSLTNAERGVVASLGGAVGELDRLFDSTANSSLTASERIVGAYSRAFGVSIQEAQNWLASSQVSADRYAEIFNNASGSVLTTLLGVTDQAESSALQITNAFGQGFQGLEAGALGSLQVIQGGLRGLSGTALAEARRISSAYSNAVPNSLPAPRLANSSPANNRRPVSNTQNGDVDRLVTALESSNAENKRMKARLDAA